MGPLFVMLQFFEDDWDNELVQYMEDTCLLQVDVLISVKSHNIGMKNEM